MASDGHSPALYVEATLFTKLQIAYEGVCETAEQKVKISLVGKSAAVCSLHAIDIFFVLRTNNA